MRLSHWRARLAPLLTILPALLVIVAAALGPSLAPRPAEQAIGIPFGRPSADAWLGTDRLGRDVFSQLLYGGWGLLIVAAAIAILVTAVACVLGTVAALRPRVGILIESATDFAMLMPAVLGILLVLTSWPDAGTYGLVVVALLFGAPYCARVFAAAAAGIAASGYVESAEAGGERLPHLVFREVVPNLRQVLASQLGLRFVVGVYMVSTASFLQLPTSLGAANWAVMVRENTSGLLLNPWSVLAPSLAIAIVAVSVNLAVDGFGRAEGRFGPSVDSADAAALTSRFGSVHPIDPAASAEAVDVRTEAGSIGHPETTVDGDARSPASPERRSDGTGQTQSNDTTEFPPDDAVVVVEALAVRGQNGQELFGPIGFRMRPGTVTALTGPSGSGKTTLMRALLGHLPAGAARSTGSVTVADQDVFALGPAALQRFRHRHIAYVGQDPGSSLNPLMRVRKLLAEVADDPAEAALLETLALVGLSAEHLRRYPAELSGGQQRRVALARALVRRTEILVLDEPLAGLHGTLRTEIAELLRRVATERGIAVLLSGHDTATIHAVADSILELGTPRSEELRLGKFVVEPDVVPAFGIDAQPAGAGDTAELTGAAVGDDEEELVRAIRAAGGRRVNEVEAAGAAVEGALEGFHREVGARTGGHIEGGGEQSRRAAGEFAGELLLHGGDADRKRGADRWVGHDVGRDEGGYGEGPNGFHAADRNGADRQKAVLRASNITAEVGGRPVLSAVDFELGAGSALAVVGASGAGKTTLARVIAGLHRTATGSLELGGSPVRVGRGRRIRYAGNGIQLVTQNPLSALNPRRTVAQTLARPLRRIGGVSKNTVPQRVTELLESVDLAPELARRYPHQLSGGQRQRVALARALAAEPAVLVCDEITSALDHATASSIMRLLDRIRAARGTALLVITHDMRLVAGHCAGVIVLDQGRIVESGAAASILAQPAHSATRELLG